MKNLSKVIEDAKEFYGVESLEGSTGNKLYMEFCSKILKADKELGRKVEHLMGQSYDINTTVEIASERLVEDYEKAKELLK